MENSSTTIGTGAVAGLAAGAGAGLLVGTKKSNKILGNLKQYVGMKQDEYVKTKTSEAVHKMKEGGVKPIKIKKLIAKVQDKAKADFPEISKKLEGLTETAKKTKNKWLLGLTAAGAAIGTAIGIASASKAAPQAEKPAEVEAE